MIAHPRATHEGPLLEVQDLRVDFPAHVRRGGVIHAVNGVSLYVGRGETLGLVGESGSGKSTIGNAILGLAAPAAGRILLDGSDITHASPRQRRKLARRIQVVFQDPYGSFNPSRTIGHSLTEPLRYHRQLTGSQVAARVSDVLHQVGLPADAARRYPAHFSGGQRQRIAIARALILEPDLIICDEPTSALDLSIQAQILNLLLSLQEDLGLAYLFISHDIDVIRHLSHRVAVLYHGRLIEQGPAAQVTGTPAHPYTQTLLAAVPSRGMAQPEMERKQQPSTGETAVARPGAGYAFTANPLN